MRHATSHHRTTSVKWLFASMFSFFAITSPVSAEVNVEGLSFEDGPRGIVLIKGPISADDLHTLRRNIDLRKKPSIFAFVESRGGDWYSAMEIGRFLRTIGAGVSVNRGGCYSACVLVLAGGLRRTVTGPVGIHRPYSTDLSPKSYAQAQQQYRALEAATKNYLADMNLPESLFDAMVRVPPESMRVLSEVELDQFGLSQNDPVTEEIDDAEEARRFGITKQEYLKRKARRDRLCQPVDLGPDRVQESVQAYMGCRSSVMKGMR